MSTYYCLLSEVDGWLSQHGYDFALDQDNDGTVETDEQSTYGTAAIVYASNLIDGYIQKQVDPEEARAQAVASHTWLKDRCIDIAVYRMAGIGGRDIPESIQTAFENTIALLEAVRDGEQIPGYVYPGVVNATRLTKRPIVSNL